MRTTLRFVKQLWMAPLAVAIIAGPATTAVQAADPAPAKKSELSQKAIAFQMNNQPWDRVLEWLTEQTGVPFISPIKPTGSFTFIAPKDQKYTLSQIIDILNEALADQKFILIRKKTNFMVIPADQPPDPYKLQTLTVDQLAGHGDSEMVNCVITPKTLVAEDLAPQLRRMMGHFGTVSAIADANELILMDTVGDIRRINDMIKDIEKNSGGKQDSFSHKCVYIRARDAEAILTKLLGDPKDTLKIVQERTQAARGNNNRGGGRGGFGFGGGPAQAGNNNQQSNLVQQATANIKVRMWYVSSDDRTNTVLVTGPANKLALAKSLIEKIDVADEDKQKLPIGPRFLKSYSVANGDAKQVAAMLKDAFKGSTITEAGNDTIIVWGTPADQVEIAKQIMGDQQIKTEVIPVTTEDPAKVATMLKGMFGESVDSKTGAPSGAPFIDAHPSRNAITVHGTADQVAQVKAAMRAIGEDGEAGGPMRIITLDNGSATTLAEELGRMLGRMRKNPVQVIVPGRGTTTPQKKPAPAPTRDTTNQKTAFDVDNPNGSLVDPQMRAVRDTRPGDVAAPVALTPLGNKVFVQSNDAEALQLAQELSRLLTTAPTGKGDFEIIPLKNGNAVSVAKILDDLFNGPKQSPLTQLSGPAARARGIMLQQQDTKPETIRVVADPASNALLVQASPLNMATVRRLLTEALDTTETDSNAVLQTFIIPLQYAQAKEVAAVVRDVYKEHLNTTTDPAQLQGRPAWRAAMASAANGNKEVTLSVGVDERTNSLVLNCSTTLYKDIATMVQQLDKGAKDTTRTVKVIPLTGVDPMMMQQILDMMQGRATASSLGNNLAVPGGLLMPSIGNFNRGLMVPQGYGETGGRAGPRQQGQPPTPGGRGFFAQRVKDDPQPSVLYDPQHEESAAEESSAELQDNSVVAQQPRPNTQGAPGPRGRPPVNRPPTTIQNPLGPGQLQVPAGEVQVVPMPAFGQILLSGNPLDVAAMEQLIHTLEGLFRAYEARLQLVYLQRADATTVANQLSQLFTRVLIGPTFTSIPTTVQQNVATPFGQQSISTSTSGSVVLQPLPRLNAIYVAAPKSRMADIVRAIEELDRGTQPGGQAHSFRLKHAAAARVATLLSNFYAIRYPGPSNTTEPDQVRITYDDVTNTVFVQAAPSDLANITDLIWELDNTVPAGRSNVRIIPLRNVLSDDLAATLTSALSQEIVAPTTGTTGTVPRAPGGFGGAGATPGLGGFGSAGVAGGAGLSTPAAGTAARAQTLRFISTVPGAAGLFESGQLQDIKIISDPRINALLVFAPDESMSLMLSMIQSLDVLPALHAEVNIFTLKKADATATASVLQQLFLGTSSTTPGSTGGIAGGIGGGLGGALGGAAGRAGGALGIGGGGAGGLGGLGGAGSLTATAPTAAAPTLGGSNTSAELLPPRISVDQRTNSVIVAAARHDLDLIEALISRLEDTNVAERMNQVYKLRNAAAADVATALNSFLTSEVQVQLIGVGSNPFNVLAREVVVVPEPVSNQLIISATPAWFPKIMAMIMKLDEEAPQVVVQALLAEINLTNTEEFGVELGLQSPVLFDRSIIPANGFLGTGSVTYDNASGTIANALVPPGVTVNSSSNPTALPGFNFNSTAPLPNNPVVNPSQVGFQGLTNLGVGRASPTSGVGGFVFSASSDALSILVRALKTQGRIDILSRPQITTLDGQSSSMLVGQSVPYVTGSTVSALGTVTPSISYRDTGVLLRVTPRISPDGKVIMRVHPEVSTLASSTINLGNGVLAPVFNDEYVDTTITCGDGETVVIGGLISKTDSKNENKAPWLGDLPVIGALFRYRTEAKSKTELIVILTSHIVRNRLEADAILAEESQRMDWVLGDVIKAHGTAGMAPIMPPPPAPTGGKDCPPLAPPGVAYPAGPAPAPQPEIAPAPDNILPAPRPVSPAFVPGPMSATPPLAPDEATQSPAAPPATGAAATNGQVNTGYVLPTEQGTEVHVWRPSNPTTATSASGNQ